MAKKVYEEANIRAIADKIREKTNGDSTYKTSEMPDGIEEVYKAGRESGGIGGYTQVEIPAKNFEIGGLLGVDGSNTTGATNRVRTGQIPCTVQHPISIASNSNVKWLVHFFNNNTWIGKTNFASTNCENIANLFNTPNEVTHIRILLAYANDITVANVDDLLSNFTITEIKEDTYNNGYEAGQKTEYDRFWDSFQVNGTRNNYPYGFAGSCWDDDTYNPKYEIIITSMATYAFYYNLRITSTKVPITIDTASSNNVFSGCTRLETIPNLTVTDKVVFANFFAGCAALANITFTEESCIANNIDFSSCPKLTKDSLMSIINALKDFCTTKIYPNVEWYVSSGPTLEFGAEYPCSGVYCDEVLIEFMCKNPICHIVVYDIDRITQEEANRTKSFKIEADGTLTLRLTNEEGTVRTLTLGETNLAKLTDKEKAMVTDKGWKLA